MRMLVAPIKVKLEKDGMGHAIAANVDVKETMKPETMGKETAAKPWPRWQKIVTGISIIWGLAGFLCYLATRRRFAE